MTALAPSPVGAATGSSVVSASVASATYLDVDGCPPATGGITDFGSVPAGSSQSTSTDCVVEFGSSNDTAALRVAQRDGSGTAMVRANFAAQNSTLTNHLKGTALVDAQTAWFAGYGGKIIRTTNGGATWTQQTSGTTSRFYDIEAAGASVAWAAGQAGVLVGSTNGGASWSAQDPGTAVDINGLTSASPTRAWAVGAGGMIRATTDGGVTQWAGQASTVTSDLYGIDAASSTKLWAVGDDGVVLHTGNGGATWALQYSSTEWLRDVQAVNEQVVWATGRDGMVIRTTNGGASWTVRTAPTGANLSDIAAIDESTAWVVGDTGSVYVTYDGGSTWRNLSPTSTISFDAVMAAPGRTWIGGQSGQLYVSPSGIVADYADGVSDWDAGTSMFAACLRATTSATPTWLVNASCSSADGSWWRSIPSTVSVAGAEIARTVSGTSSATAALRFGLRVGGTQAAGVYEAGLLFEVTAPAP